MCTAEPPMAKMQSLSRHSEADSCLGKMFVQPQEKMLKESSENNHDMEHPQAWHNSLSRQP